MTRVFIAYMLPHKLKSHLVYFAIIPGPNMNSRILLYV